MNLQNTPLTVGQMPDLIFKSLLQEVVQIEKSAELAPLSDSADNNQDATFQTSPEFLVNFRLKFFYRPKYCHFHGFQKCLCLESHFVDVSRPQTLEDINLLPIFSYEIDEGRGLI